MVSMDDSYIWIVVLGFIVAFVLALGLGANDVANSFGTSVGSKVLSLKGACVVATICETAGAVLAGGRVTDTIRGKIVNMDHLENGTEGEVLIGSLSALTGAAVWLIAATAAKLPVSSTHSIVGAMMGFGLVAFGSKAIKWREFVKIVISWIISPMMAGFISAIFYLALQYFILKKPDSYNSGLKALPVIYFVIITVNVFAVFYNGSEVLHFNSIPLYGCLILSLGSGLIVGLVAHFVVVPFLKEKIDKEFEPQTMNHESVEIQNSHHEGRSINSSDTRETPLISSGKLLTTDFDTEKENEEKCKLLDEDAGADKAKNNGGKYSDGIENKDASLVERETSQENTPDFMADDRKTDRLLAFVQILTASFASFAHGSNDVSNAIGPLVSLWLTFKEGRVSSENYTPIWILFYGGVGISIGLWIWGRRVIETIGEELSSITPSSGFIIEFGTVFTVLLASNLGIPISTTHCLVGSVIIVGLVRSRNITNWKVVWSILFAWLVTVPISGAFAAGVFAAARHTV